MSLANLRRSTTIAFAATLLFGGAAVAGDARVALPLRAPAGTHPIIADFLEICSRAMIDRTDARDEAGRRGWIDMSGEGELEDALKARGNFALAGKDNDDVSSVFLIVSRADYAHVRISHCAVQTRGMDPRPAGFVPAIVGSITGVVAGDSPLSAIDPAFGNWSFLDEADEIVAISSLPIGGENLTLSMERAERVSRPDGSSETRTGR